MKENITWMLLMKYLLRFLCVGITGNLQTQPSKKNENRNRQQNSMPARPNKIKGQKKKPINKKHFSQDTSVPSQNMKQYA